MSRVVLAAVVSGVVIGGAPASAQLADAGKNDQHVSFFFLQSKDADNWVGGVTSRGDRPLGFGGLLKASWQLDYGALGDKRTTPTGAETAKEVAVSKNSGMYTASYIRRFGSSWRLTGDAGVEHKRIAPQADELGVQHRADLIAAAAIRNIGARLLGSNPDTAPELAWSLQASLVQAGAILPDEEARKVFLDPVAVLWLSVWPTTHSPSATAAPLLYYRVQFRAEGAAMQGVGSGAGREGHWDGSVVYFFTPANGVMLRRFGGYFDHNLRDRKTATTLNIVWKFR